MSDRWWNSALCAQIGGDFFVIDQGQRPEPAKEICQSCEVRVQCLMEELAFPEQGNGIFGGFGIAARRQLRAAVERGADPFEVAVVAIEREQARHAS